MDKITLCMWKGFGSSKQYIIFHWNFLDAQHKFDVIGLNGLVSVIIHMQLFSMKKLLKSHHSEDEAEYNFRAILPQMFPQKESKTGAKGEWIFDKYWNRWTAACGVKHMHVSYDMKWACTYHFVLPCVNGL